MARSRIKYTAKGRQMLRNPKAFLESFLHAKDSCSGQLVSDGKSILCTKCSKKTPLK